MLLDILLPKRCALCGARAHPSDPAEICRRCQPLLPWQEFGCEICGAELFEMGVCGACLGRTPHYDRAIIPCKYRAPVAGFIQALKYHRQLQYANCLGAMICRRIWKTQSPLPEVLIPVPLHRTRLRQRGFNQAFVIAQAVRREFGLEINYKLLKRVKNTRAQTGLSARARRDNVRGAFQAVGAANYAHAALVDDVVTTGHTANAAARALKVAGVKTVSIWAAAHG